MSACQQYLHLNLIRHQAKNGEKGRGVKYVLIIEV